MATGTINTDKITAVLRPKVIDVANRRLLMSRIGGSGQEKDMTLPANCEGLGRVRHFKRNAVTGWPDNPLPIDPAHRWLKLPSTDAITAQVFQLAACAWRCWYCFVPYPMLSADPTVSEWRSAAELVDLYFANPNRPPMIDLTGGSPDLAPEWIAWTMDAVEERGAVHDVYLWSDDNLSSDRLLTAEGRSILDRINAYGQGYGKVCCLKGFDEMSFVFNTSAKADGFERQISILEGYSRSGVDLYGYITLTSPPREEAPDLVRRLVNRLAAIREDLPARFVPLRITEYSAMDPRVRELHHSAMEFQWELARIWAEAVPHSDQEQT